MTERHPLAEQCTAKAKGTGRQCRRRVVGGGVCRMHGGATKAATAKRLERIALAEQVASAPRRHPGVVLLEALHLADVLSQRALAELKADRPSPKTLLAAVEASQRAGSLARTVLSAEAEAVRAKTADDLQGQLLRSALSLFMQTIGLQGDQRAEQALVAAVQQVASQEWMPLNAAAVTRRAELTEDQGKTVVRTIEALLSLLGLTSSDPWVRSVISSLLRAVARDELAVWEGRTGGGGPPRSWWLVLARHACRMAGLHDPAPVQELLPPAPVAPAGELVAP